MHQPNPNKRQSINQKLSPKNLEEKQNHSFTLSKRQTTYQILIKKKIVNQMGIN